MAILKIQEGSQRNSGVACSKSLLKFADQILRHWLRRKYVFNILLR